MVFFVFVLFSCEEDELTIPSRAELVFSMKPYNSNDENTKLMQGFQIDEGNVVINAIIFEGQREQGEDYYFTNELEKNLEVEMHTGNSSQKISYDIPQGVYNRIDMAFGIGAQDTVGLRLAGNFQHDARENVRVVFEYDFEDEIRSRAKNHQGNEEIVLDKDKVAKINVILDASFIFKLINPGMMQYAERRQINNEEIILINNEVNTNLYGLIVSRIDNSFQVIFE